MEHLQAREIVNTHFKMREDFKFTRGPKKTDGRKSQRSDTSSVPRGTKARSSVDGGVNLSVSTRVDRRKKSTSS